MQGILDKKIPSLLGIFIIVVGIATTTLLVKRGQVFQTNAGPGGNPKDIKITNVSDSSFTVTYVTDDAVFGTIKVGENPDSLDQTFLDDRDKSTQKVKDYKTHSITINNLTPSSTYYFSINSGDNTTTNNGTPFTVTTGPSIPEESTSQTPIRGKAVNPDGTIPDDGIILVSVNGSQVASAYLNKDGGYEIPLNKLRSANLNNYFRFNENTVLMLEIKSGNLKSKITTSASNLNSIPLVILSHNYDFLNEELSSRTVNSSGVQFPQINPESQAPTRTRIAPSPLPSPTITLTPQL